MRMALLCIAGLLYVKTRSYLAGDQLVRIYRKVRVMVLLLNFIMELLAVRLEHTYVPCFCIENTEFCYASVVRMYIKRLFKVYLSKAVSLSFDIWG
jgi:hypothetical protein